MSEETWRLKPHHATVLESCLADPVFSESEFLGFLGVIFPKVSCRIESAEQARALFGRLQRCTTLTQARQLLNPEAPEPRFGIVAADRDVEAAKASWTLAYTGCEKVLDTVASQLRSYAGEWDPVRKYVPLTSIVQSSGWGKSRLVHQLWSKDMYVFYISCMGEKKSGYPFRTPHLADLLRKGSESDVIALLASIMCVLGNSNKSCLEWIQWQQEASGGCYNQVWEKYKEFRTSLVTPEFVYSRNFAVDSVNHYEACLGVYTQLLKPLLEKLGDKFLLLVVDEAMDLGAEQYTLVRRALKYVPAGSGGGFFTVALGTDSTVSSLAASYDDDPSARVRLLGIYNQLYTPIWLVGCSDLLVSSETSDTSPETVMQFGRPLWAGYIRCLTHSEDKRSAVVRLAMKKLLGREVNIKEECSKWVTRDVAVAVLGTLIGLDVVAWGTLPQQAVARHMKTIVNISEDRNRVYTAAAAEPALAAAAAELLHTDVLFFVNKLTEVFVDGLVLEGVRGEMVARLILLLAMHECTKKDHYIAPVRLSVFLAKLYGNDIVNQLQDSSCVDMDQQLFFNYFVATRSKPSNKRLRECYRRNAASICKRNETHVNLHLPTQLITSSATPSTRSASVAFQIKNWRDASDSKLIEAAENVDGDERVDQSLSIVQNVGGDVESVKVEDGVLIVRGLVCEFIKNKKLKAALKNLTKACENELKHMSEEQVAVLEDLVPLAYKKMADVDEEMEEAEVMESDLMQT